MNKNILILAVLVSAITSCKPEKDTSGYFPAKAYLQSEIAKTDSLLLAPRKITFNNEPLPNDTVFMQPGTLKKEITPYLELLPDFHTKEGKSFTEEEQFDETLQKIIFRYAPEKPEEQPLKKLEIMIIPGGGTEPDKVATIYYDYMQDAGDSMNIKKIIWQAGKSFQVTEITQYKQKPEKIGTLRYEWGGNE